MNRHKESSLTLAILFVFTLVANPLTGEKTSQKVLAQTNAASPSPQGSNIKIDGSDSLKLINESLKTGFEKEHPGSKVIIQENGSDAAIKALQDGKIDIAGIGRPLTAEEKNSGLRQTPITYSKIAIITSSSNPFKGDIPLDKFAAIFLGKIKNFSEIGGPKVRIRVIDRPDTSDTRRAFSRYPLFQKGAVETGSNAVKVPDDKTDSVVNELGNDGIGYAVVDQVTGRKDVTIVPMNQVLPSDSRYPFSQPLAYVYKGPNPSAQAKAFLCSANGSPYAATLPNGTVVSKEFCQEVAAAATPPVVAVPPAPAVTTPVPDKGSSLSPWLLLLPLLGGAGVLAFLAFRKPAPVPIAAVVPPPPIKPSRLILVPRTCREAYAYWEVPNERQREVREQGGTRQVIRLYDVTDNPRTTVYETFETNRNEQDLHIPIPVDNRDYVAELGYLTGNDDQWLSIARSKPVKVPACPVVDTIPTIPTAGYVAAAGAVAGAVAVLPVTVPIKPSRVILVPRNCQEAYAYWEVPIERHNELEGQGGVKKVIRLYDVTDNSETTVYETFEISPNQQDLHIAIPVDNRDYVAELGYLTADDHWLPIAKSEPAEVPACPPVVPILPTIPAVTGYVAAAGAVAGIAAPIRPVVTSVKPSRIVLVPHNGAAELEAYAYWEVPESERYRRGKSTRRRTANAENFLRTKRTAYYRRIRDIRVSARSQCQYSFGRA